MDDRLEQIRAGQSLLIRTRRGRLVAGPTTVVKPGATIEAYDEARKTTVRVVQVVGTFSRDGVDYATAVFTKLPQARRRASRKTRNPTKENHMFTKLVAFLTAAASWCHRCGHAAPDKKCLCPDCGCGLYS